ncbi:MULTISPECIES: hypothetical protein [Amycolatopsis]|uniref:Uncharacterized protein n=2 Tax=Amycolatopsis TaxID=1813 RepID=A0A1I4AAR0_9PSEU|nr:hypothetical protein [Amycolatopsis sacchari]SFK53051.1 hypothetical protein SAMN05421835_12384 [Amycolatopsis sacchari]
MNDAAHHNLNTRLRRIDQAVEAATADLLRHRHNERALDDLVVVGRRLLELSVDLLSHAPDLDLAELDNALMGVVAATLDRPATPPDLPHRRVRLLRLGPLTLTVITERSHVPEPDDKEGLA